MPRQKSSESKAKVRGSAKERVADKNVEAIGELLVGIKAAKEAWDKEMMKKSPADRKPFIPDPSLVIARITASQGGAMFTIEAPGRAPMQAGTKGNAALGAIIAQQWKTVKLAEQQWPIVICCVPTKTSHVKTGEILAILHISDANKFMEFNFKVPVGVYNDDDLFDGEVEDTVDIDDL